MARYQEVLDGLPPDDDDTPIDNFCLTAEFGVLAGPRARATQALL